MKIIDKDKYANPFILARQERIETVRKMLICLGKIEYKKAAAKIQISLGISKKNAEEIIKLLIDDGFLKFNRGIIEPNNESNASLSANK